MSTVKATWKNGQVVLEEQPNWPEGRELVVAEVSDRAASESGEEWPNSPEAVADWLKWYDSLEPLLLTPAEEADTEAWLRKMNEYALARMEKGAEDAFR